MSRKVVLVNISRGLYDHSQNPPQSPFIKGGGRREILPFDKGELEGLYFFDSINVIVFWPQLIYGHINPLPGCIVKASHKLPLSQRKEQKRKNMKFGNNSAGFQ